MVPSESLSLCWMWNFSNVCGLPKIWRSVTPLHKSRARACLYISCLQNEGELQYKASRVSHTVEGVFIILSFFTKYSYGVGYTVSIFLLPEISLSARSEASLMVRQWDTALYIRTLDTYMDTTSLFQRQKVAPIIRWEASVSMLDQWAVFL